MSATKFHIHTKQQAKLVLYIFILTLLTLYTTKCNIQNFYIPLTENIYLFFTVLETNRHYFAVSLAVLYARSGLYEKRLLASSCLSVCVSFPLGKLGSHLTDIREIWYLNIFLKYVEKIKV